MNRLILMPLLFVSVLAAESPKAPALANPMVPRGTMRFLERAIDDSIQMPFPDGQMDLIGVTRGVHLDGYGVVLTSEINLMNNAAVTPFHPKFTPEEVSKVKATKLQRLPALRQRLQQMLLQAGSALSTVPPTEKIVIACNIFYFNWEDSAGMPTQILMQATRKTLIEMSQPKPKAAPAVGTALPGDIRVVEY